jgi:hypothetical protein
MEGYTPRTYKVLSRKGKQNVEKTISPKKAFKVERSKTEKLRTRFVSQDRSLKQKPFNLNLNNDTSLIAIRRAGSRRYWHWGCYGSVHPCMGCALSAPVYGDHLPPSINARQCPSCLNWVYRASENDLCVQGCVCIDREDEDEEEDYEYLRKNRSAKTGDTTHFKRVLNRNVRPQKYKGNAMSVQPTPFDVPTQPATVAWHDGARFTISLVKKSVRLEKLAVLRKLL